MNRKPHVARLRKLPPRRCVYAALEANLPYAAQYELAQRIIEALPPSAEAIYGFVINGGGAHFVAGGRSEAVRDFTHQLAATHSLKTPPVFAPCTFGAGMKLLRRRWYGRLRAGLPEGCGVVATPGHTNRRYHVAIPHPPTHHLT